MLELNPHQPLRVILCHLPEKGRREIEEIVEMKERDRGERKMNESEETDEIKTFPTTLTCCKEAGLVQALMPGQVKWCEGVTGASN